ncbi:MAG: cytochrome b/b6 domain-containing protein [Gemmobacter sp.]
MKTEMLPGAEGRPAAYGAVSRALHWAVAVLILVMMALGLAAKAWPLDTGAAFAVKAALFSTHKTLGMVVLLLALVRIGWAMRAPAPAPLASHPAAQRWIAGVVHWALYAALVLVPLSGWLHHATSAGFAPIWWPFPQTLAPLPQDPALSAVFGAMHGLATKVLGLLALAHVAGALLHHWRDGDDTLRRMTGGPVRDAPTAAKGSLAGRALPALALWAAVIAAALALPRNVPVAEAALGPGRGEWAVEDGAIAIAVTQIRDRVSGRFGRWNADIAFSPEPVAGRHGTVRVEVDVASLTIGAVTAEALAPQFLDAGAHPLALFEAAILPGPDGGYVADGQLTLRGQTVPVRLPFTLALDGDAARMAGQVTLDRRDFGVGAMYADESTVGFSVEVAVEVAARRRSGG